MKKIVLILVLMEWRWNKEKLIGGKKTSLS